MSTKPTLIFIPGAFHVPASFEPLLSRLERSGYTVHSPALASVGARPTLADPFAADVSAIQAILIPAIEDRHESVALIAHSYGAVVACEAALGLSAKEREERGLKGGITRLVFLAGNLVEVGDSIATNRFETPDPAKALASILLTGEDEGLMKIRDAGTAHTFFYNDVPDGQWESSYALLKPIRVGTNEHIFAYPAYRHIPSAFLVTKRDRSVTYVTQQLTTKTFGIGMVEEIDAGHIPWLMHSDLVESFITRACGS